MRNFSLLFLLFLGACASPDGLSPKAKPVELKFQQTEISWWKNFSDPQLDALVSDALSASPDIGEASARVDRAKALQKFVGADLSVQVSAAGSAERQKVSKTGMVPPPFAGSTVNLGQIGLDFSYEFDFWQKNRSALKAAISETNEAEAEKRAARLLLAASICDRYFSLQQDFAQREIAEQIAKNKASRLAIARAREREGLESRAEIDRLTADLAKAKLALLRFDENIALAKNAISALVAKSGLDIAQVSDSPPALAANLPANALGFRPDILAMRLAIEASSGRAEEARAQFYPNVNLAAFAGFQSIYLSSIMNGGNLTAQFGPAINLPIYGGGRLRANLAAKYAEYDIAVQRYNRAVQDAMREVADSRASLTLLASRFAEEGKALAAETSAAKIAAARYRQGLSGLGATLEADISLLEEKSRREELRGSQLRLFVSLMRAFGGHLDASPPG